MKKRGLTTVGILLVVVLVILGSQSYQLALGFQAADASTATLEPSATPVLITTTPTPTSSPTPIPPTATATLAPSPTQTPASQAEAYSPCKNRVNVPDNELHWLYIPQDASQLATYIDYAYLAGQLIKIGAVDAATCPAGGLGAEGYANACGLARAKTMVHVLQNIYDQPIMDAWDEVGVPPVMLKQLLRYESQFWPGISSENHYGTGHMTYFGAATGLAWRLPLRQKICAITGTCEQPEVPESEILTLLSLMDASCPSCEMGVDVEKAQRSIYYLAEVLLGHCYQTSQVVFNATGFTSGSVVDYATIWKLTLFDYNAGPQCVYKAVKGAYTQNPGAMEWNDIRRYITDPQCQRGAMYVYQVTAPFYDFP